MNGETTMRTFTWNRAHWIGMVCLTALLMMLILGTGMYAVIGDGDPYRFAWLGSMLVPWPVALGCANVILGSIRNGSLSFPLASALLGPLGFGWANLRLLPAHRYLAWSDWLALMRTEGVRIVGQTLYGMAVLLVCYAAVAFICYAIGRYALRALFVDPDPDTFSGRLLAWIRADAVRFGCWLSVALVYGMLLAAVLIRGNAAMAGALLINFVIPPLLLVSCGVYASRAQAVERPWRALLFPLVCSVVPIPLLMALIFPYEEMCPVGSVCTQFGDWYINWSSLDQVWLFTMIFSVASFLGFAVVWVAHWLVLRMRRRD